MRVATIFSDDFAESGEEGLRRQRPAHDLHGLAGTVEACPVAKRLGDRSLFGRGKPLVVERVGNAARALALGRYAFNLAREHALTRHQFALNPVICFLNPPLPSTTFSGPT